MIDFFELIHLPKIPASDNDIGTVANQWMMSIVGAKLVRPSDRLEVSKDVLKALYSRLSRDCAQLWMVWNVNVMSVMDKTFPSGLSEAEEVLCKARWSALVSQSRATWKAGTEEDIVESTPLDEGEEDELLLAQLEINGEEDFGIIEVNEEVEVDDIDGIIEESEDDGVDDIDNIIGENGEVD